MSATTPSTLSGSWVADPIHSTASFAIQHMAVSTYRTSFKEIEAALDVDGDNITLTGTVPVESVDIELPDFRGHVLSPDFFDAANHPNITFVSTAVRRGEGEAIDVDGELTVKGVTKPVHGTGIIIGPAVNIAGIELVGVQLETTVNKNDFDLNWNAPLPKGGMAIGDEVTLTVHLEMRRKEEA
jgi:polyisoprenoid-binding protein YceI